MKHEKAPNLMFSHMGISVNNLELMERFYTELLGFTVTDRGKAAGMDIVFLSRDPADHHQIVLATGRPDRIPENSANPAFGPCINQISFRMPHLADLREMYLRLKRAGYEDASMLLGNHGIAWSVYFPDPEHNMLELFVETDWYVLQPLLVPLDFSLSDAEILAETEALCLRSPGFEPARQWRERWRSKMAGYESERLETVRPT